ncbi:MAG TPA: serine hydrolase domain-containing protein [Nocardioides sp.]|nr:serine hydrolase domain-containing protein [Nocardioides sp.]
MSSLPDDSKRHLHRAALHQQREGRVPGLAAAVARDGDLLWYAGIGTTRVGSPETPGPDDQYLVGSNTKTFTAVMLMQLRDEGRLALDDLLADHLPDVGHPVTVRQALAHVSGMQREPLGDVWDTLEQPDAASLVRGFAEAERVGRPHTRWHYSNLAYAVLGQVVEKLDGRPWVDSLDERLLRPLEMRRTTVGFVDDDHVTGYFVPPFHDVPREEPVLDLRAMTPVGGLASTARDLARWSAFVASPPDEVLSADTLEEMCQPQVLLDTERWNGGMGLGLFVLRTPSGRTWVGHDGGMPGHLTALLTHRESGTGGIVLMSNTAGPDPGALALQLAERVVEDLPVEDEPWRPGTSVPEELAGVIGRWYSEGRGFVFSVREGRLEARQDGAPASRAPSVFVAEGPDRYRTESGRERGELLRVTRDPAGAVDRLHWATYVFTRAPLGFGEHLG